MRKVLFTLLVAMLAVATKAEVTYVINATNAPVGGGTLETMGVTVKPTSGTVTFASGKNGTIKYSKGKSYTVTLPATANVKKITFYGYGNEDGNDAYLSACGSNTYTSTQYVFRSRTTLTAEPYDKKELTFATPLKGSFQFTFSGAQACITISMVSDEQESEEAKDAFSLGKYSDPNTGGVVPTGAKKVFSYPTPASQMEKLDRGLVALPEMNGKGVVLTWRMLGTDVLGNNSKMTFDIERNGTVIKSGITKVTNYKDANGTRNDSYVLVTKVDGVETERSAAVSPWGRIYKSLKLDRPKDSRGLGCLYAPNDMSVGDVDNDGQYELIVKWNPTNARDNSQTGTTGNVFLDAYRLDGTKLWRIDLGRNIRAGAHYTQFLVYDFDGDGKAEVICKTAPGSKDGKGNYVSEAGNSAIKAVDNSKNCMNGNGHPTSGEEFLTVFNGLTGEAMHTIWYNPPRSGVVGATGATTYGGWESVINKSTNYNRGERYNASVAYLDGPDMNPSAVMQRGYYTYAFFWAVDWDGKELKTRWVHYGDSKTTWKTYDGNNNLIASSSTTTTQGVGKSSFGQGVHGISVGDVNGDGYDEIVMGAATIAHDGKLLCSTGMGHGDAIHLSDLCPDRPGLEVMMPHEENSSVIKYGYDVHDASTGAIIYKAESEGDNGRGLAADVLSNRGFEFWTSAEKNVRSCINGTSYGTSRPSTNFRIYWDGDLQDEMFDGKYSSSEEGTGQHEFSGTCAAVIEKLKSSSSLATLLSFSTEAYGNAQSCNTTKATPCLIADIFGDWREELILWDGKDPSVINIYSSNVPSTYCVPTLMHDHTYRMGITWQNSSYNQPPHLGYYLPDMFDRDYGVYSEAFTGVSETTEDKAAENEQLSDLSGRKVSHPVLRGVYVAKGQKMIR